MSRPLLRHVLSLTAVFFVVISCSPDSATSETTGESRNQKKVKSSSTPSEPKPESMDSSSPLRNKEGDSRVASSTSTSLDSRLTEDEKTMEETQEDKISRESEREDHPEQKGKIGELPSFQLQTINGNTTSREQLDGKVAIVNFWATWCGPCRKEVPQLQKMKDLWGDRGFEVVGIAVRDTKPSVKEYRKEEGVTYPMGLLTERIRSKFEREIGPIRGVPTTVIADRDGTIVNVQTGLVPPGQIVNELKPLLKK